MTTAINYDSQLWRLLEEEKLADLSQFHQPGFFDEVPLYSRDADVDFLPRNRASEVLLRFALKLLSAVVAYEEHTAGYFAAVTVWSASGGPLVPNLFVSCGPARELQEKLTLEGVTTSFGKQIEKLVKKLRPGAEFVVLEDNVTIPDTTRVFIAPARPPYRGFVSLDALRRPANGTKHRTQPRRSANGG